MLKLNFPNTKTHLFLGLVDQVVASWMPIHHHKWSNSNILGTMMSLHVLSQFDPFHRETIYLWAAVCKKHYVCELSTSCLSCCVFSTSVCVCVCVCVCAKNITAVGTYFQETWRLSAALCNEHYSFGQLFLRMASVCQGVMQIRGKDRTPTPFCVQKQESHPAKVRHLYIKNKSYVLLQH